MAWNLCVESQHGQVQRRTTRSWQCSVHAGEQRLRPAKTRTKSHFQAGQKRFRHQSTEFVTADQNYADHSLSLLEICKPGSSSIENTSLTPSVISIQTSLFTEYTNDGNDDVIFTMRLVFIRKLYMPVIHTIGWETFSTKSHLSILERERYRNECNDNPFLGFRHASHSF